MVKQFARSSFNFSFCFQLVLMPFKYTASHNDSLDVDTISIYHSYCFPKFIEP